MLNLFLLCSYSVAKSYAVHPDSPLLNQSFTIIDCGTQLA